MKGGLLVVVLIFLVVTPIVSAFDAKLTVKTDYPFRFILVRVLDSNGNIFDSISPGKTDIHGVKEINYTTSRSEIGFLVFVIEDGQTLQEGGLDARSVNKPFILDIRDSVEEEVSDDKEIDEIAEGELSDNETAEDESSENIVAEIGLDEDVLENEDIAESSAVAGNIVSGDGGFSLSNTFYYIIGFVVLLAVVGFVAGMVVHSRKREMMGLPKSKLVPSFKKKESHNVISLENAERKLEEAQEEINKIKSGDKIRDAEERLEKDKEELDRLRRGE